MILINPQVRTAIIIYIIIILVILLKRKDLIFDNNMNLIPFGFNNNQSLFSFPILAILIAIIVYYAVSLYGITLV